VRARAQERVLEAIERGERGVLPKLDNPWVELLSFGLSRALMLYVDDDWLRRRWALAEAARVERLLHGENDEVLLYIINDLGLQVKTAEGKWIMHFSQYLHLSKRLGTEPRWKLVNRLMDKGLVTPHAARGSEAGEGMALRQLCAVETSTRQLAPRRG
jgi:DNA primase large subunit